MLHVTEDPAEAARSASLARLEATAATIQGDESVSCTVDVVAGDPAERITEASDAAGAELIVIGPARKRQLRQIFRRALVGRLLRQAPTPVLVAAGGEDRPYRRVLVAVDMSPVSAGALEGALDLGLLNDVEVSIHHGYDGRLVGSEEGEDTPPQDGLAIQSKLESFIASLDVHPTEIIARPHADAAGRAIEGIAQQMAADLIVVGTRARTGAAKVVFGSVAEDLLSHSTRDVLVVPTGAPG